MIPIDLAQLRADVTTLRAERELDPRAERELDPRVARLCALGALLLDAIDDAESHRFPTTVVERPRLPVS